MRYWDNCDQDSFVPECRLLGSPEQPDTYQIIKFEKSSFNKVRGRNTMVFKAPD